MCVSISTKGEHTGAKNISSDSVTSPMCLWNSEFVHSELA